MKATRDGADERLAQEWCQRTTRFMKASLGEERGVVLHSLKYPRPPGALP